MVPWTGNNAFVRIYRFRDELYNVYGVLATGSWALSVSLGYSVK